MYHLFELFFAKRCKMLEEVKDVSIPRETFDAMEPVVKEAILEDYWIPKDERLPLLKKGYSPYKEVGPYAVDWQTTLPVPTVCAFHGTKMYLTNKKRYDVFYCPVCKKYYEFGLTNIGE